MRSIPIPIRGLCHSLVRSTRSRDQSLLLGSRRSRSYNASSSSFSSSQEHSEEAATVTDVLIVGGGAVGCALARQLALRLPRLTVGLVEAGPGPIRPKDNNNNNFSPVPHPRSYALSPASLDVLGLDQQSSYSDRLGYYDSMQIWEASQPATVVFDKKDVSMDYLGAVVEDSVILDHLWKGIESEVADNKCRVWTNTRVSKLSKLSASSLVQVELERHDSNNNKTNSDSTTTTVSHHQTRLLVAADGANSQIRKMASIDQTVTDYGQTALTFTVQVERPLAKGRCFQRFLPSGPLALLPTFSNRHAIIVWSTTPEQAAQWKDNPGLIDYLNEQLQHGPEPLDPLFPDTTKSLLPTPLNNLLYGLEKLVETLPHAAAVATLERAPFVAPPRLVEVASPQFAFPLSMRHASSYIGPRLALVGDAAHTVHPMAGQGLNLGLHDVASLVQVLETAVHAGMDPSSFLQDYETSRRLQVAAMLAGIHALHQVFAAQTVPAKYLKALGMNAVQTVTPLRQVLVQAACLGGVGSLGY